MNQKSFNRWGGLVASAILSFYMGACGSGSTSTTPTPEPTPASSVSNAFPLDLALASPTNASAAPTGSISASKSLKKHAEVGGIEVKDYLGKKAILEAMMDGTAVEDCAFTLNLLTSNSSAQCYGPTLTYSNHPNSSAFDSDTSDADGLGSPNDTDGDGSLPGGDLGIWRSLEDGTSTPCAAGQLNKKVDGIATQVDSAEFAMASMICLAKVNEIDLPEAGSSIDLTSEVSSGFTANEVDLAVSSATLARDTDDADGNAVYVATLAGTTTDAGSHTQTVTVRLKHIPTAEDNSTYKGKLSYSIATADGSKPGNCGPSTATGQTDAVSISYEKTSATSLTYQLQSANFCGDDADPYVSATNFTVDLTKDYRASDPDSDPKGWANNANVGLFNLDPSTGAGNFEFAWQAGSNDSNTRVLNAGLSVSETSDTTLSGCAYFGYGPSVQDGSGVIDRMICNWAGPGGNHTGVDKAQSQCFDLDTTSGDFTLTSENITYAPTLSCDSEDGTDGHGNPFIYEDGVTTINGDIVSNDLIDLTEISSVFTEPTAPSDIDL